MFGTLRDISALLATALVAALAFPCDLASETTRSARHIVIDAAAALAARPFEPPPRTPESLTGLGYDAYRNIRYRKSEAIWGPSATRFSVEMFAPGMLFRDLVDVAIIENGRARTLSISPDSFETPDPAIAADLVSAGKFSGFRLHYPLNRADYRDEFAVFQGASYFRAVSAGQVYGLSARGLAIATAQRGGEEFPVFRSFWIERPAAGSESIVVHALLDSPSVAGAYRFGIYPGRPTTMDIQATLFPRRDLSHYGLAPLTSMFHFGAVDPPDVPDYRPAVHDSEGLAILTGRDEAIWRPLVNPPTLQVSAFLDSAPKGFGLIQRSRAFRHYQDLEADYGRRPSAWIQPLDDWGPGHVELIEIPTDSEVNDNIVAYWRPDTPLRAGQRTDFSYRLTWPDHLPDTRQFARVIYTGIGRRLSDGLPQAVVDYDTSRPAAELSVEASASRGAIREAILVDNDETGGVRMFLTFDPQDASIVELRTRLKHEDAAVGETWLYRWLAP